MRSIVANVSIGFVIILNFLSGRLGWDAFDYNWLVGSLICSLLLLLDDNRFTRVCGMSSALIFTYLITDKGFFDQFHIQANDIISILIALAPIALYAIRKKPTVVNPDLLLLLLLIAVKIISENLVDSSGQLLCIRMFGANRSYYELFGNFSLLLMAIYLSRNLKTGYFMPFLFIAFMVVEQSEYISNDPYHFEWHEGFAISIVLAVLLIARKRISRLAVR